MPRYAQLVIGPAGSGKVTLLFYPNKRAEMPQCAIQLNAKLTHEAVLSPK